MSLMVTALTRRAMMANFLPSTPRVSQTVGSWIIASNTQPRPIL
jgi:hypothetical protein